MRATYAVPSGVLSLLSTVFLTLTTVPVFCARSTQEIS